MLDVFAVLVTPFASDMSGIWVREHCEVRLHCKVAGSSGTASIPRETAIRSAEFAAGDVTGGDSRGCDTWAGGVRGL